MKKNKKKRKLFLIPLIILALIVLCALTIVITGKCPYRYKSSNANPELSSWMSYIKDDAKINEIVIPGSHDSGSYDMSYLGETQYYTIKEQLECGTRYFDLRIKIEDDVPIIYHSIINGVEAIPIFQDIQTFLNENPTEFLILDFQHFDNGGDSVTKELIDEYFSGLMVKNETNLSDLAFVSNLTLSEVRGKCLVLFGDGSSYTSENYIFERNNDDCTKLGQVLDSYYVTELNSKSSSEYVSEVLPFYISQIKEKNTNESYKGLFVLQCQLTDGNLIFGPWSRERSHQKNMVNYISTLSENEDFSLINIIMRDFVNEEKNTAIIELNLAKNTVKDDERINFQNILDNK